MNWVYGAPLALLLVFVVLWLWRRVERRLDERERRLKRAASTEVVRYRAPGPQPPGDSLDRQFAIAVVKASDLYREMRE